MAADDPTKTAATDVRLPEREAAVLAELGREGEALVAFQGLRRRLGIHQQALSRTLRRLEDDGLIAQEAGGYRLTEQAASFVRARHAPQRPSLPLAQAALPPHVDEGAVAERLAGRWFHGLRWYGRVDGPGSTTLIWLTEKDGEPVRVRLGGGSFALEAGGRHAPERATYAAARMVLGALAELYGLDPDDRTGALTSAWPANGNAA